MWKKKIAVVHHVSWRFRACEKNIWCLNFCWFLLTCCISCRKMPQNNGQKMYFASAISKKFWKLDVIYIKLMGCAPPRKLRHYFVAFCNQGIFLWFFSLKFFYYFTLKIHSHQKKYFFFVLSKLQNLLMESTERFCDTRHAFIISSLWHYDTHHHLRSARDFWCKRN